MLWCYQDHYVGRYWYEWIFLIYYWRVVTRLFNESFICQNSKMIFSLRPLSNWSFNYQLIYIVTWQWYIGTVAQLHDSDTVTWQWYIGTVVKLHDSGTVTWQWHSPMTVVLGHTLPVNIVILCQPMLRYPVRVRWKLEYFNENFNSSSRWQHLVFLCSL